MRYILGYQLDIISFSGTFSHFSFRSGVTFVKLSNVIERPKKHKNGYDRRLSHVKLFMHTQQGKKIDHALVADMKVDCRVHDQISTRIYMHRPEDLKWIVGQIAPGKHSEDDHFIPDQWNEPRFASEESVCFIHKRPFLLVVSGMVQWDVVGIKMMR